MKKVWIALALVLIVICIVGQVVFMAQKDTTTTIGKMVDTQYEQAQALNTQSKVIQKLTDENIKVLEEQRAALRAQTFLLNVASVAAVGLLIILVVLTFFVLRGKQPGGATPIN